jgi:hypothetical protein
MATAALAVVTAGAAPVVAAPAHLAEHGQSVEHGHHYALRTPDPVPKPPIPKPPKLASLSGNVAVRPAAAPSVTAAAVTDRVALRPLIIATEPDDFGLPTWKAILDSAGSPYDVLYARSDPFDAARLLRADGSGRYSAIFLTDSALLYQDAGGNYQSAFDATKWNALWTYERTYHVRQVSLYTAYGTFPEDYCLRAGTEGAVTTPVQARLTTAGAGVFDTLQANGTIPIEQSYLYRSTLAAGCSAQPVITLGSSVLGVLSTSSDGRERVALSFSSNQYLQQTELLGYGLVRWATKGVFLGEERHWINVDADDWFNTGDHLYPDGHLETDPGFRLSGPEAQAINQQQVTLRQRYPLAAGFTLNLPYNGGDIDTTARSACSTANTPDPLTSYSRCLAGSFRWLNHTVTHQDLNFTTYAQNSTEIGDNLTLGRSIGLTVPTEVLKTPAYSGLGVYNPDPNAPDDDPPTDFGLGASNRELLRAANDLGVKYLHGNMSFVSEQPSCFNCGIAHPLQPSLFIVPDWPTNIAYQTTTPAEQIYYYNLLYGPQGRFPFFDHNLSYAEMVDYESNVALQHVMSGSAYSHTVHQGNLHQYGSGQSLTFDWLTAVVSKYSAHFKVPLKNPDWPTLARYSQDRTAHFASLATGVDAVWDRTTNTVTYSPGATGALFVTGMSGGGGQSETYGPDTITRVGLTAGQAVTLTARPRS